MAAAAAAIDMDAAAGRVGIEYHYRFWRDDDVPRDRCPLTPGSKYLLFEIRTDFVVKTRQGDEITLGSERFPGRAAAGDDGTGLLLYTYLRLAEYWMTHDEARQLTEQAVDFASQISGDDELITPVAVGLKVCTVQQEGETIDLTRERAIRADHLIPLYTCLWWPKATTKCPDLMRYLHRLSRIRVQSIEQGLSLMAEDDCCYLCKKKAWIGTQISRLPCGHAFHSHCIVPWLECGNLCPSCHSPAYTHGSIVPLICDQPSCMIVRAFFD